MPEVVNQMHAFVAHSRPALLDQVLPGRVQNPTVCRLTDVVTVPAFRCLVESRTPRYLPVSGAYQRHGDGIAGSGVVELLPLRTMFTHSGADTGKPGVGHECHYFPAAAAAARTQPSQVWSTVKMYFWLGRRIRCVTSQRRISRTSGP